MYLMGTQAAVNTIFNPCTTTGSFGTLDLLSLYYATMRWTAAHVCLKRKSSSDAVGQNLFLSIETGQ
jgi:hypothetical protein